MMRMISLKTFVEKNMVVKTCPRCEGSGKINEMNKKLLAFFSISLFGMLGGLIRDIFGTIIMLASFIIFSALTFYYIKFSEFKQPISSKSE